MIVLLELLLCAACGKTEEERTSTGVVYYYPQGTEAEADEDETEETRDLFLLLSIDNTTESMRLYRYANGMEYQYYYSLNTQFLDKYGNRSSAVSFVPGRAVYLGSTDQEGKLRQIQIAEDVWEYDNIRRFSVEEERGIFYIADTKYNYDEETFIFSNNERIMMEDLTDSDRITVIGQGKKILSVMVTTGHGELQLVNTELFEGSYLQLDTSVFTQITSDMQLELPEGEYTLSVANNGWGGSCEITIARGETTTVDLDGIKGEGSQYGTVLFSIDIEGAKLSIDGETVDYSEPLTLTYGWHSMVVTASGYEDWSKYLYVNSKEATIIIELEEESAVVIEEEGETTDDSHVSSDTDNAVSDELLEDYLSTLTEMLGSL